MVLQQKHIINLIISKSTTCIQDGWRRINYQTQTGPGKYALYVSTGDTQAIQKKRWAIDYVKECDESGKRNKH